MSSESASPWPKNGVSGQIRPAKRTAPEWADELDALVVAYYAFHEDRELAEIWRELAVERGEQAQIPEGDR